MDIVVTMVLDEDNFAVEWDGNMPRSIETNLEKNYHLVKDFPLQMLNMALNNILEDERGMRPPEEIAQLIDRSEEIKTTNPADDYEFLGAIAEGGQA